MNSDAGLVHERELYRNFVARPKRDRWLALLESNKGRKKIREELPHFDTSLFLHATPVLGHQSSSEAIQAKLEDAGAPKSVYVISEDVRIDCTFLPLPIALENVVGQGFGSFISCIPGRLAYFEGEEMKTRFLLRKNE